MNIRAVERIADAILYEGYLLYPYHRSALKNHRRWDFGIVYPPGHESDNEPSVLRTECLVEADRDASIQVHLRFLQVVRDESMEDASPRTLSVAHPLENQRTLTGFEFPPGIQAFLEVAAEPIEDRVVRVSVSVKNTKEAPEDRRLSSLFSTNAILSMSGGEFISLLDPPERYRQHASECRNVGLWPVLVGESGTRNVMLASPIILYDYPQLAPESAGDLFDATEIDELLTMRVRTLTDDEKEQVRNGDPRGREILERSERLSAEELLRLHGTMRSPNFTESNHIGVGGITFKPGDRVRLRPQRRADVFDLALNGRSAVIEAVEQDFENQIHYAVILDDDPGRDLGAMRYVGHRFFFAPDEVEPLES